MSRPGSRDNSTAVSLFPFLAVLLCTMGALVVLLVVMAQAASRRAQAANATPPQQEEALAADATTPPVEQEARAEPDEDSPDRERAAEESLAQAEKEQAKLDALQKQFSETLRDDLARLTHIENHIERLKDQVAALRAAERELAALEESYQDDRDQAAKELERLEQLIAETEEEIERAEEEQRGKQKSYAIVPYKGPNGTRRRPLYIECRKDTVVLQPEGIVLEKIDFRPPLGVGNPLSAALRAARKYYQQAEPSTAFDPDAEPYPLVIVRPDGIELYHRVRAALQSGETDFGYEMVDAEWELAFGLPNPTLANRQANAVDAARLRRHLLSQAAPSAYESDGEGAYDLVPGVRGGRRGVRGAGGVLSAEGDAYAGGSSADSVAGRGSPYSSDDTLQYGGATREGVVGSQPSASVGTGSPLAGAPANGLENQQGTADSFNASDLNAEARSHLNGSSAGEQVAKNSDSSLGQQASQAESDPAGQEGGAGSNATSQVVGQPGGQASGSPMGSPNAPTQNSGASSFSANFNQSKRGGSGSGAFPNERRRRGDLAIRRAISVVVYDDRVSITPVDAQGRVLPSGTSTLPLNGPTQHHLGDLMAVLRRHVDSWGIAGRGFYWKPVLVLSIAPDGGQRANELVSQLAPRGVEVRYHSTANANRKEAARAQR